MLQQCRQTATANPPHHNPLKMVVNNLSNPSRNKLYTVLNLITITTRRTWEVCSRHGHVRQHHTVNLQDSYLRMRKKALQLTRNLDIDLIVEKVVKDQVMMLKERIMLETTQIMIRQMMGIFKIGGESLDTQCVIGLQTGTVLRAVSVPR